MAILGPIRFLLLLLATAPADSQSVPVDENQVKAVFLYNFAKFVDWPADSFKSPADPITICVLDNAFGGLLEQVVSGKQIDQRHLVVREITEVVGVAGCNLVFIGADKKKSAALISFVRAAPILTVGNYPNFASAGGMIGFKVQGGKVRLEINIGAAERAHLRISSKLLSLAEIVTEAKK